MLCRNTLGEFRGTARSTPQYKQYRRCCGELDCVLESRSGVIRLQMQRTLRICFQIKKEKKKHVNANYRRHYDHSTCEMLLTSFYDTHYNVSVIDI